MTENAESLHADLVREYLHLAEQVEPLQGRMDEIRKVLRADLPQGSHKIAGATVQVARNARMDMAAFAAQFPVLSNPGLYKAVPDPDAIKRQLAPMQIEALQVEGEPRLVIK